MSAWTSRLAGLAAAALVVTACGGGAADPGGGGPGDEDSQAAWEHLATVEDTLDGQAMAAVVEDPDALADAWSDHGFPGGPPAVDFTDRFVLLLAQPDDACVDELIRLEESGRNLAVEWLPPPGGCDTPLILRLHAISVHRAHLTGTIEVAPPEPYGDVLEPVSITLPPYDGTAAPAAPAPPTPMSDAELDAVFAGHPVRRCTDEASLVGEPSLDGPLSDDPEVANAQQARAEFGVASDEASTRTAMDEPAQGVEDYGAPLTADEIAAEEARSRLADEVASWLQTNGFDPVREVTLYLARHGDGKVHVRVDGNRVEEVEGRLREAFGDDVVGARLVVEASRYELAAIRDAQQTLGQAEGLMGTGPGQVAWTAGEGPLQVGMVDPTREALDRIADLVDLRLVCVVPELSGVRPGDG